jgi:hypothetical protein
MTHQPDKAEAEREAELGALEQRFAELMRRFWRPLRPAEGPSSDADPRPSEK